MQTIVQRIAAAAGLAGDITLAALLALTPALFSGAI